MLSMRQFSTFDAKNRLSELLDAVARGETIEITRRGKPAARLVPIVAENERFSTPEAAANWLRANRVPIDATELRSLRDEGRK